MFSVYCSVGLSSDVRALDRMRSDLIMEQRRALLEEDSISFESDSDPSGLSNSDDSVRNSDSDSPSVASSSLSSPRYHRRRALSQSSSDSPRRMRSRTPPRCTGRFPPFKPFISKPIRLASAQGKTGNVLYCSRSCISSMLLID